MSEHTLQAFEDDLRNLKTSVGHLGDLAVSQLGEALRAILSGDLDLARDVIERDDQLAGLKNQIERDAIVAITRHAPMADDLRLTIAAIKMGSILERIGDHACNIAKRALVLAETGSEGPVTRSILERLGNLTATAMRTVGLQNPEAARDSAMESLSELGSLVCTRLRQAIGAYTNRAVHPALELWETTHQVDDRYCSLIAELIANMIGDTKNIATNIHMLFVTKNLERIGDYAANIAEITHFETIGVPVEIERQKSDELSGIVDRVLADQEQAA